MKEAKESFKKTLKVLKRSRRADKREYKADRLLQLLRQKRRFGGDPFYGKQRLRLINCAYMNPPQCLHASAVLEDSVDADTLETALCDAAAALPALRLNVRRGFFSPYLQGGSYVPAVRPPSEIAAPFAHDKTDYDFRVSFYKRRITAEMSSYLGDFYSLSKLLSCLVLRYFELKGDDGITGSCSWRDKPTAAMLDDPFRLIDRSSGLAAAKERGDFARLKGDEETGITNLTCFQTDTAALKTAADTESVNSFLLRLWGEAVTAAKGGGVRIGCWLSGREFYQTDSLRCFTVTAPAGENFSCDFDKRGFDSAAAFNLRGLSAASGLLPMPIKTLKYARKRRYSAIYADAGKPLFLPCRQVVRYEGAVMGAEPLSLTRAVFGSVTCLTILSKFSDSETEYEFYKLLSKKADLVIGTNRRNNLV